MSCQCSQLLLRSAFALTSNTLSCRNARRMIVEYINLYFIYTHTNILIFAMNGRTIVKYILIFTNLSFNEFNAYGIVC